MVVFSASGIALANSVGLEHTNYPHRNHSRGTNIRNVAQMLRRECILTCQCGAAELSRSRHTFWKCGDAECQQGFGLPRAPAWRARAVVHVLELEHARHVVAAGQRHKAESLGRLAGSHCPAARPRRDFRRYRGAEQRLAACLTDGADLRAPGCPQGRRPERYRQLLLGYLAAVRH